MTTINGVGSPWRALYVSAVQRSGSAVAADSLALLMTTLLADRAARIESGPPPSLAHDDFVREVVSMLLGMLTEARA